MRQSQSCKCGRSFIPERSHQVHCSSLCRRRHAAANYYLRHTEKLKARAKDYAESNREKVLARYRAYHFKHKKIRNEQSRLRVKLWRAKNPDKARIQWVRSNASDKGKLRQRRYNLRNAQEIRTRLQKWRRRNKRAIIEARKRRWKYDAKYREMRREIHRRNYRKGAIVIAPSYVARLLNLPRRLLPDTFISTYRANLKLKRQLKSIWQNQTT